MAVLREPKLNIRAQYAAWKNAIEILISEAPDGQSRKKKVVTSMGAEEIDIGVQAEPTLRLSMEDAQTLMNDLWHCGIRPTDGVDSPGELKATKYHLEDMRKLVFDKG